MAALEDSRWTRQVQKTGDHRATLGTSSKYLLKTFDKFCLETSVPAEKLHPKACVGTFNFTQQVDCMFL